MEIEAFTTLVNTVGFPIAAFAAMYYLVAKAIAANTAALKDLEQAIKVMCNK